MIAKRNISRWAWLPVLILSLSLGQMGLRASDAVLVTIEAENTTLAVGESTLVTVYGQIDPSIEAGSNLIFSWYIDVLNDNGASVDGYANVQMPSADNDPDLSGSGTPEGTNLRGIYNTFFLGNPGAGKGSPVVLVQFELTAQLAGTATISVAAGSTVPGDLSDFRVAQIGGGSVTGGNYAAASLELTVTGEVDLSSLDLQVRVNGSQSEVRFNPVSGFNHTVQFSDTLLALSWVDLPGAPHNSGTVNQGITGVPKRFYRVILTVP